MLDLALRRLDDAIHSFALKLENLLIDVRDNLDKNEITNSIDSTVPQAADGAAPHPIDNIPESFAGCLVRLQQKRGLLL